MNKELIIENEITINAPAGKVWDILTNPEQTKKYMFGCEAISDWKPGSPLDWKGSWEGKEMVFVKGIVSDIVPGELVAYTTIDPNNPAMADVPENYLTVTYRLTGENSSTLLKVTQGNYATVADGQRRYEESYNNGEGWNPILVAIKNIAETA
jgi:uncharacterized protein YndB with AHSA1/START domain